MGGMRAGKVSDIEGLRGFAVFAVICYHVFSYMMIVPEYFRHGWSGVDLFFVISGFVVTRAFHRDLATADGRQSKAISRFYIKRVYRILPTLLACIGFWLVGMYWFNSSGAFGAYQPHQVWQQVSSIVFMYANYVKAFYAFEIHLFPVWSLSVEEQFYLLFPVFAIFIRDRSWRIAWLSFFIIAIAGVYRPLSKQPWTYLNYASDMRFDELAAGVLLAEFTALIAAYGIDTTKIMRSQVARVGASFTLYCLVLGVVTTGWFFKDNLIGIYKLGCFIVMILAIPAVWLASLDRDLLSFGIQPLKRALEYLGSRSYALYLYHMPADWTFREVLSRSEVLQSAGFRHWGSVKDALLYSLILFILVEINYRLIERPLIRYAHRKFGSAVEPIGQFKKRQKKVAS